jgi:hypothetical protein
MTYVIRMGQYRPRHAQAAPIDVAEMDFEGQILRAESRHGANMALARVAVARGAPDGPWVGVDSRTGRERLYGRSLHALARLTVEESDRGGVRFARWQPYPGASC